MCVIYTIGNVIRYGFASSLKFSFHEQRCNCHVLKIHLPIFVYFLLTLEAMLVQFEPRREKNGFLHMRKQRLRSASLLHQRLCFLYIDSTIPLLSTYEISSLKPSSVVVQPGLCRTWWKSPKTGFLTTRLISLWFFCCGLCKVSKTDSFAYYLFPVVIGFV